MNKVMKILCICLLSIGIVGCSSGKKELSTKEVAAAMKGKYEIKTDVIKSTNELLRVNILFNEGKDTITYTTGTELLAYKNSAIKDVDAMLILYNKTDKYDILANASKEDSTLFENFVASFDKNMSTKQFIDWCLEKGKEEDKKHTDAIKSMPDANTLISKIKEAGYEVTKSTGNTKIVTTNLTIIIKNGVIGVYDSKYDFNSKSGLIYLPQNDGASKQVNGETLFIYQFSTNSYLQGEASLEEYAKVKSMKEEYDTFMTKCKVSQEDLATLK